MGVNLDFDEFNSRLLDGDRHHPRMTNVPVRMPLPTAKRQGIDPTKRNSAAKKSYFNPSGESWRKLPQSARAPLPIDNDKT